MANKTLKKYAKTARKNVPIGRKKSPWKKALPVAGSAAAAAASSFALTKAVRKAGDVAEKGKSAFGEASDLKQKVESAAGKASDADSPLGAVAAAAKQIGGGKDDGGGTTSETKLRHIIKEETEVGVPRSAAYNQWTQFKEFSKIFKGVQATDQKEDEKLQWTAKIGPSARQWTAEITEQVPDERIKWKSTGGANIKGVVSFHSLDDNLTKILVEMEYHPQGVIEKAGNLLRIQRRRVRRDLRLFKHFLELRGDETGAWRGEISEDGAKQTSEEDSGKSEAKSEPKAESKAQQQETKGSSQQQETKGSSQQETKGSSPNQSSGSNQDSGSRQASGDGDARKQQDSADKEKAESKSSS